MNDRTGRFFEAVPGSRVAYPLHEAVQNGQVEMVKLFIEYGADPYACLAKGANAVDLA